MDKKDKNRAQPQNKKQEPAHKQPEQNADKPC